jgi:glycosyltransferase involved in cell wall biosynthesis
MESTWKMVPSNGALMVGGIQADLPLPGRIAGSPKPAAENNLEETARLYQKPERRMPVYPFGVESFETYKGNGGEILSSEYVPVTAMLPAHQRIGETLETIKRLLSCSPGPDEILVHVAESQVEMLDALNSAGGIVKVLTSKDNIGPGGARNKMRLDAKNEIVASFDDDSYPEDRGFFQELLNSFERLHDVSILALNIYETGDPIPSASGEPHRVRDFVGCGCAYRRSHFKETSGYVPLPTAYGMEEADLSLRYCERNRKIYFVPALRIFHNTVLAHHQTPVVSAMQIANTALLAFLRYPLSCWPLACAQVLNKWLDTIRRKRWRGALVAAPLIWVQIWKYRSHRKTVAPDVVDRYRTLPGKRSYQD